MSTTIQCPYSSSELELPPEAEGRRVSCPQCGHPFAAEKPKKRSDFKNALLKGMGLLFFCIAGVLGKWVGPMIVENFTTTGKEKKACALIADAINEYRVRLKHYGSTMRNSGILDIYVSQTVDELVGRKAPKKYRRAIENALEEAKSLNLWCEQKLNSFDPQVPTEKSEVAKRMVRDVYKSYYEISSIGIKLFSKTLECHKIHCGMKSDASQEDKEMFKTFAKNKSGFNALVDDLCKMDEDVMQIAQEYASVEKEKMNLIASYGEKLK